MSSSDVTSPSQQKDSGGVASPSGLKAKAKAKDNANAEEQDDDEDEEDEDEDEEMDSEDEEGEEDKFDAIDPTATMSRRTRGIRVDYTSKEALAKAGLGQDAGDDEDTDEDMKE